MLLTLRRNQATGSFVWLLSEYHNPTKNRTIKNNVCNECTNNKDTDQDDNTVNYDDAPCDPEDTLGNIN